MSGLSWLEGGPEEWSRQYLASRSPLMSVVARLAFAVMPTFGKKLETLPTCPLCSGAHTLSQCRRWRLKLDWLSMDRVPKG